ncbi:MAG TPA: NUDIX hydrolase [Mycobacteriales bacterium]|nr:NUDIX hydrolase [Mycobacteriales bacterium]
MTPVQRVAAYAVLRDDAGRVLVTRSSAASEVRGWWSLPGGGVEHGEHPADAAVREAREESGLDIRVHGLPRVYADVLPLPALGVDEHTVRLVYDAEVIGGELRPEPDGTSDAVEFADPGRLRLRPLLPFVAEALALPVPPPPRARTGAPPAATAAALDGVVRRQRLAAYGLAYDRDRLLVTQLSATTPMPDAWTLPGGGVDHGEHPAGALVREFAEETGLAARVGDLLGVYSTHFTGRAPSGVLEDFHGIRLVYAVRVDGAGEPRVVDLGGTTSAVAWHPLDRLGELATTPLLREALSR